MRLSAVAVAVSLCSCAGALEEIDKLEDGLKTANTIVVYADKCANDAADAGIAACELLPGDSKATCLDMLKDAMDPILAALQAWRVFRCEALGGLGQACGSSAGQGGGT